MTRTAQIEAAAALLGCSVKELQAKLSAGAMPSAHDRLLRPREAAALLGVSRRTVANLMQSGRLSRVEICPSHLRLDGRRVGGRVGVPLSSVERIMVAG